MNKDVKKFVQSLTIIEGVTASENGGGHIKIFRDGKLVVTLAKTPSDHRWRDNAIRNLRAVGITPSVTKLDKQVRVRPAPTADDHEAVRRGLQAMRETRGERARFAVFVQGEAAEVLGRQVFLNVKSAESSLSSFATGQSARLRDDTCVFVQEALRLWNDRKRSEARHLTIVEEVEAIPEIGPAPGRPVVVIEVNVQTVNRLLEQFGFTLAVVDEKVDDE